MKKEFYNGQPLIIKETGDRVTFVYDDGDREAPCYALKEKRGKQFYHDYYDYEEIEPSTEFKFSEIIAGLEQGYFEVGTEFESNECATLIVDRAHSGLGLKEKEWYSVVSADISADSINTVWRLVEPCKEMTLEEIEAELGYKIKLKEKIGG